MFYIHISQVMDAVLDLNRGEEDWLLYPAKGETEQGWWKFYNANGLQDRQDYGQNTNIHAKDFFA